MWTSIIQRPHTTPDFAGLDISKTAHTGFADLNAAKIEICEPYYSEKKYLRTLIIISAGVAGATDL